MKLRDIVRADKSVTDWGKWQAKGKMPRSALPLSRSRGRFYRLGRRRWKVVRFSALDAAFRLLIAYSSDKEQYQAILAAEHDQDMTVLARYEFHGTHPGWHVHASCEDIAAIPTGAMCYPSQLRLPRARKFHRRTEFGLASDEQAVERAAEFFGLHQAKGLLI